MSIILSESRTALTMLSRSGLLVCGMSPLGSLDFCNLLGLLSIAVTWTCTGACMVSILGICCLMRSSYSLVRFGVYVRPFEKRGLAFGTGSP